jgi:diacylglycerol kinase family enzyme
MRVVSIVNRRARALAAGGPLLAELSRRRDGVCCVETSSLGELDEAVRRLADDPPETVVLAGGDGSYMAGVTALVRTLGPERLPAIALAPGGTVSTVARNWGFRGDAVKYARRVLDGLAALAARRSAPPTILRPTLRVRGDGERVGFIVGAGLVARFFEVYERAGAPGYAGAARIVGRIFAGSFVRSAFARAILDPQPCMIEVDGARAPFDRVSLACASVVPDLGLSMRVPYRAAESLDRFHVVATPLGPVRLGPQMPLVLAGRPLLGPRVDTLARAFALRFPAGTGAYVLDGELLRADGVDVTPGPVLRIVSLVPDA